MILSQDSLHWINLLKFCGRFHQSFNVIELIYFPCLQNRLRTENKQEFVHQIQLPAQTKLIFIIRFQFLTTLAIISKLNIN